MNQIAEEDIKRIAEEVQRIAEEVRRRNSKTRKLMEFKHIKDMSLKYLKHE